MVDVWIPYGNTEVCLRVAAESFLGAIGPNEKKGLENPQEEVERSLKEPIGTKRLSEIVKPGDKTSIVFNGVEDSSLNLLILKSILKELNAAGARNEDINVIRGYDPLRVNGSKGGIEFWSDEILKGVKVIDHKVEAENCLPMGETHFGTKVYVNRRFLESKVKIVAGFLEPHPYTGYSGGRDGVLPGVSSAETVQHNLSMVTGSDARPGLLKGNPVHEDMVEAARLVKVDFTLNVMRNSKREIVKAFAGDLEEAFNRGAGFADEMCKVPVEGRADAIIVSPGGSPFDVNLYESCKGLNNILEVVKKNGILVLVSECSGGYGNSDFYEWMAKLKDLKRMENSLKKHFTAGGYVAYSLMKALDKVGVVLVSTFPDYHAFEVFKLKTARTVNEALRFVFDARKNSKILVFPHGNVTIPVIQQKG